MQTLTPTRPSPSTAAKLFDPSRVPTLKMSSDRSATPGDDLVLASDSTGDATQTRPYDEPLEEDAPWPENPTRQEILGLARYWGKKPIPPFTDTLDPVTNRDVVFTATASVKFLRRLRESPEGGELVNQLDICIDHAGRLDMGLMDDYYEEFDAMVFRLDTKLQLIPVKREIENAIDQFLNERVLGYWLVSDCDELESLASHARAVKEAARFETKDLRRLQEECNEVVRVLKDLMSVIDTVKDNFIDDGHTPLERWHKISRRRDDELSPWVKGETYAPHDVLEAARDMNRCKWPIRAVMGATRGLKQRLEVACKEIENVLVAYGTKEEA